ncbi:conjugal transfer protein TraP (plasmid) [Escherichia coli]|nr:conjugal transfer protein TraP [Escherichia coli]
MIEQSPGAFTNAFSLQPQAPHRDFDDFRILQQYQVVSLSRKLMACCINQVEQIIIFSVSYRQLFSGQSHQLCSVTVKKPASPVGFFTSFVSAKSAPPCPSHRGNSCSEPEPAISTAYSALFDHGLASKSDQRFASIRSTGNLTFSTAF